MESLIDDHQWLVKFEEHPESGKMRLLDPVTNSLLKHSPESTPKNLNLLEFRVIELRKSYGPSLSFGRSHLTINSVHRLVVMPRNHLDFGVAYAIFMIRKDGKLEFARCGDEKLTNVDGQNSHYHDIIVYEGQCYVVDKWGIISWVNSALEVIQFSPPLCGFGGQKHLVESCGDLYVVDQYFEEVSYHHLNQDAEAIGFRVYKLDQEWGKWVNVKDLGDQVLILSNDGSFSVSTTEFPGVKGNCILFIDRVPSIPGRTRCHSRVFSLEDGRIRNLASWQCSQMVQLPSTWLNNLE